MTQPVKMETFDQGMHMTPQEGTGIGRDIYELWWLKAFLIFYKFHFVSFAALFQGMCPKSLIHLGIPIDNRSRKEMLVPFRQW